MPNQRTRLPLKVAGYQIPIAEVGRLTGIDAFAALQDHLEHRLEADTPPWPRKRERRR